ncbi:MAG: solute:Na+ symporter, family [Thermosediminibacterales bacterium]|nr:solute:Na+ symporter, family [Thermosediminibacterales bacterium]
MSLGVLLWVITLVMCGAFLYVSWKVSNQATSSFSHYAIGGGTFPIYLIFCTQFATIMGVGNFVGHAGKGYSLGLPHIAFILGEQGSKIVFALVFAALAGRFTYNTFTEMIDDLLVRDKVTRALGGLLASMIMIAWVGGQGKGFGTIFNIVTGANPIPIILFFSAVFILYTTLGGIYSVVWTDLIQGILVLIFGTAFYIYAFSPVHWSIAELGARMAAVGKAELWSFSNVPPMTLVTKLVTGCIGILAAQIYWQRCFSAKDGKTARNGLLFSGIIAIIMVMLTALVGMVILTLNQGLKPDDAMPWFMLNYVPVGISAMIFVLILAAGMSSADSNLNSAAILIVNDLIKPFKPDATDKELVKYATTFTVIIGIFAALAAIYAKTIIGLFSKAYAMAGGGLVPLLIVGLLWKERPNEPFEMGKKNSKITPWGARIGLIAGSVLTQISALGPNRVIIALVVSTILIVVVSSLTRGKTADPSVSTEA